MAQQFLVVGGTGMLGLPVARKLKEDGFEVTILTTSLERTQARLGNEFRLVEGDVTEPETLRAPLEAADFVHLNLSARLDKALYQQIEIDGTANVARIARETGIKRIGMISGASSTGKESGIIYLDAKVKAERTVMESGVPYTIMRPSWFFETLPFFIQKGRASILGKQPIKRFWLAASDYTRQVSTAFQTEEAANRCFYNLGPRRLNAMEALQMFCARHHPELKPANISYFLAKMLTVTPGTEMLKKAIPFFKYFETQPEPESDGDADRILGPNLTTLEEWLESYQPPE